MILSLLYYHVVHLSRCFWKSYHYILIIIHWYHYIISFCTTYLCIIYFTYAASKFFNIFKYHLFIYSIPYSCCCMGSCSSNCYNWFNKCECIKNLIKIRVVSLIWSFALQVPRAWIYIFNPVTCSKLRWLSSCIF